MKVYDKYTYGIIGWFLFELVLPLFPLFMLGFGTYFCILNNKFSGGLYLFGVMLLGALYLGSYPSLIRSLTVSIWTTVLTKEGIYGKRLWGKALFFRPYPLLTTWGEIEKVEFHKPLLNWTMSYVKIYRNDGKKFIINIFGVKPYNWMTYRPEKYYQGKDRGINLEMLGIIAWKTGLEKMVKFPEKSKRNMVGGRMFDLSMEGMQGIIEAINRHELPYRKLEEQWAKEGRKE